MFGTVELFRSQFTPVDGGYLVYPSPKLGGKLVSDDEHELLVKRWTRVAGWTGLSITIAAIFTMIFVWFFFLADLLSAPEWTDYPVTLLFFMVALIPMFRASAAPRRLTRGRAAVAPARSKGEARRQARAALDWRFITFILLFGGFLVIRNGTAAERTVGTWVGVAEGILILGLTVWLLLKRRADAKR